jgi:hypothetical protein
VQIFEDQFYTKDAGLHLQGRGEGDQPYGHLQGQSIRGTVSFSFNRLLPIIFDYQLLYHFFKATLFPSSLPFVQSHSLPASTFSSKPLSSQLLYLFFKAALFPASLPFLQSHSFPSFSAFSLKPLYSQFLCLFFKAARFPASPSFL